jgi:hypothetical protein
MRIYRQPAPWPERMTPTLTFALTFALQTGVGPNVGGTEQIFDLNNLFNPDHTGSSHQPYGFDQLMVLYNRFIVKGIAIEAIIQTAAGTKNQAVVISVQPSNATLALTGTALQQMIEKTMDTVLYLDSTGTVRREKFGFPIHVIEGITEAQYADELDDYSGTDAASPAKTPYLRLSAYNLQDNTQPTVNVTVVLRFKAEFYQRNILPQST